MAVWGADAADVQLLLRVPEGWQISEGTGGHLFSPHLDSVILTRRYVGRIHLVTLVFNPSVCDFELGTGSLSSGKQLRAGIQ